VLALDSDAAGLRSGLKSTTMALAAGFDVKIPKLPDDCKDPADVAAKDPELLKTAVRESKTAIEFFLDALHQDTRDERAYKKTVETHLLPLIAALPSKIDQSHFVSIVASRLRVPEDAVRAEVAKKPRTSVSTMTPDRITQTPESKNNSLSRLEQAAAMILARERVPKEVEKKLEGLMESERIQEIREKSKHETEKFQFEFESMEGEDSEIYENLLATIAQEKLDEDIAIARTDLHSAQISGDSKKESELLRHIIALTKQKHVLKK
jgi:DNA primase